MLDNAIDFYSRHLDVVCVIGVMGVWCIVVYFWLRWIEKKYNEKSYK